ncbi:T9SS type B sorting domain-containing protein, partial [Parapedobacter tibetensis]
TFTINPSATPEDIADVLVNGVDPSEDICIDPTDETVLTAMLSASSTITNPVFHWYDANGDMVAGGADGTLNLGVLAPGTYTYRVGVSGDGVCETAEVDRTVVTFTTVFCDMELSITKVADEERVVAGESTSFTVTITNNGPGTIQEGEIISVGERPSEGVTITGYEVVSGSATVSGTGNSAAVTTTGTVATGESIVIRITADIDADAPATITNGVDVWGPDKDPETEDPDDEDDTPEIPVDRESTMGITKVADQNRVKAGTSTTFTVTVTNNGPSVIEVGKDINLTERPSEGLTITGYEVTSGAATIAGSGNMPVLTTTGKIAVGGTIIVKVTADVDADAPSTISNGISVWGPDKDPDTDPDDEDDTPEIPVDPDRLLSITKVADQDRVQAGTNTSFTVTVTNEGPSLIANGEVISLVERPGEGVTITGYEVISGSATVSGTGNEAAVTTTAVLPVQGTIVLKITAAIADDAEGTITNGIAVWGPDKDPDDGDPDDETETPEIPVDPRHTLSITKVADQQRVTAGGSTSFTVTVTNEGPSTIAVGKTISLGERPSDGLTITGYEVTSSNATVAGTGNSAILTATAAIAADETIVITVNADVTASAGQTVSNGIAVWGPDKDPDTDDEDDEDQTPDIPVDAPYTLSIDKAADQSLVQAGQATTFTVTITNNGPLAIEADELIALEERPGAGVTITGYEIVSGAATIAGTGNDATITTTGVMAPQSTIVVKVTAMVAETAVGTITNGIAVWSPGTDPDDEDPDDEDEIDPVPVDAILVIPNLFTPNGDGLNDRFVIRNLLQYSSRELLVLNRWGNQVYKSTNYNNDWDGGSLSEGTYYYILRVRNDNGEWQTYKGAVALIRVTNR